MSGSKISIVLAATALLVSVLFATPLGQAASRLVLPKNSVGTAQIKNGAVTKKKINKKTIAALRGARGPQGLPGAQGQRGPSGPRGVQGLQGLQGSPGLANVELVPVQSANDSTSPKYLNPTCPGNKRAISVGGHASTLGGDEKYVALIWNEITGTNASAVGATEVGGGTPDNWTLSAVLVCANVQ